MIDLKNAFDSLEQHLNTYTTWHSNIFKANSVEDKNLRFLAGKLAATDDFLKLLPAVKDFVVNNPGQDLPNFWAVTNNDAPATTTESTTTASNVTTVVVGE